MKQIPVIDSLRSFAALSVCLYHFICTTTGLVFPDSISSVFLFGQNGVLIFFVISGFIIPWSMYQNNYKLPSILKFMAKRLIRLEPPYLASIILVLSFIFIKTKFHLGVEQTDELSLARVGLHLGYLINFFPSYKWLNNVYWTLAIEFQYYLVMSLMFVLFIHKKLAIRVLSYLVCFISAYYVPDSSLSHFPAYAPLFLFGISIFQFKAGITHVLECIIIITACFIYNFIIIEPMFAYCGIITAWIILWFSKVKIPVLDQLGKISYSMYLVHPILGAAIINILCKHAITLSEKALVILAGLIVTFVSAYIMYLLIEKPSKKLSSKLKL